ncbi:MAG: hypothetical protein AAFV71_26285 [Cyanobacteria bacterium J06633_8]
MTNSQPPEDLETRVATVEEQLNQVLESLDLIATIQRGLRVEVRENSQTSARLERTVRQLAEISARTQAVVVRLQETMQQQNFYLKLLKLRVKIFVCCWGLWWSENGELRCFLFF